MSDRWLGEGGTSIRLKSIEATVDELYHKLYVARRILFYETMLELAAQERATVEVLVKGGRDDQEPEYWVARNRITGEELDDFPMLRGEGGWALHLAKEYEGTQFKPPEPSI